MGAKKGDLKAKREDVAKGKKEKEEDAKEHEENNQKNAGRLRKQGKGQAAVERPSAAVEDAAASGIQKVWRMKSADLENQRPEGKRHKRNANDLGPRPKTEGRLRKQGGGHGSPPAAVEDADASGVQ